MFERCDDVQRFKIINVLQVSSVFIKFPGFFFATFESTECILNDFEINSFVTSFCCKLRATFLKLDHNDKALQKSRKNVVKRIFLGKIVSKVYP